MKQSDEFENKINILPYEPVSPITYDIPSHYGLNAALSCEKISEEVFKYLYERYTYLHCIKAKKWAAKNVPIYKSVHISYRYSPYLKRSFKLVTPKNIDKLFDKILGYLDKGMYLKVKLDSFYLPGYKLYNAQHHMHQEIVYGYDRERKSIYLFGHSDLIDSVAKKNEVTFQNFKDALKSAAKGKGIISIVYDKVMPNAIHKFSLKTMYRGLKDYYNANNSFFMWLKTQIGKNPINYWESYVGHVYGIDVINELKLMLQMNINKNTVCMNATIIKFFEAYFNFSDIMYKRVEFLNENYFKKSNCNSKCDFEEILKDYYTILNNAVVMKRYLLKSIMIRDETKSKQITERIINLLEYNYNLEKAAGKRLLSYLKAIL